MENYYRMKAMDLHNEICKAIAQIIPAEGIVFNAALRDEMEDSDHVIPSLPVIDDDSNCAYYDDLFVATKTDFRTIDSDTMRPYGDLDVFELLNIHEYLTDVYEPYIKKRKEQQEREAHAKRMEDLKKYGFFEFQGHVFKAYASLPKCEIWDVILGEELHKWDNGHEGHSDFYKNEGAGDADVFYMDGYDLLAIPGHYCIFKYVGLKKGKKLRLL